MKKWILNTFFKRELGDIFDEAMRQGSIDAFEKAREDLEEEMVDTTEERVEELANKKLNDLLSPVDLNTIVTLDKQGGIVYIGGVKADQGKLANLKSEAEFILASELWKIVYETPKELAQREMFVTGDNLDSMKKGRSILYTLSSQNNILQIFKSFVPKK